MAVEIRVFLTVQKVVPMNVKVCVLSVAIIHVSNHVKVHVKLNVLDYALDALVHVNRLAQAVIVGKQVETLAVVVVRVHQVADSTAVALVEVYVTHLVLVVLDVPQLAKDLVKVR